MNYRSICRTVRQVLYKSEFKAMATTKQYQHQLKLNRTEPINVISLGAAACISSLAFSLFLLRSIGFVSLFDAFIHLYQWCNAKIGSQTRRWNLIYDTIIHVCVDRTADRNDIRESFSHFRVNICPPNKCNAANVVVANRQQLKYDQTLGHGLALKMVHCSALKDTFRLLIRMNSIFYSIYTICNEKFFCIFAQSYSHRRRRSKRNDESIFIFLNCY